MKAGRLDTAGKAPELRAIGSRDIESWNFYCSGLQIFMQYGHRLRRHNRICLR